MNDLRENVKNVITQMFNNWDCSEITELVDNITEDVVEDVIETSDFSFNGHYNNSDIEMAVKRVILKLTQLGK
jgi:hypothetical protein